MNHEFDGGSFRDPAGHVFQRGNRIFRTVSETGRENYEATRSNPAVERMLASGSLIGSKEVGLDASGDLGDSAAYILEHPRLPFISYPYEWSFSQLRAAALHHLDVQLDLLASNLVLSDASAYNIQFVGTTPVFIDRLSLAPYQNGQFWSGHRQFCEQFLNPLLLRSSLGIPHNAWFRGSLEGIPASDMAKMLPLRRKLSWNVLTHVFLQAKLDASATSSPDDAIDRVKQTRKLTKQGYQGILTQLRNWIARLKPADQRSSTWGNYAKQNTYSDEEVNAKRSFIANFASTVCPTTLIDLGCNSGDYSAEALNNGADYAIGFDFDHNALDLAFSRAQLENLNFLPLWLDAANPSPNQGWLQNERQGFAKRARADAVIALAFEHHLAIAKNAPLKQVVSWITDIAPVGVIEFVPKEDSTVRKMLALRQDIFPTYTQDEFESCLTSRASIVSSEKVSASGRVLYWYARRD